ncbi:hypothetical protein U1Q18_050874 [Sarracenia purpurea var. burkii]
MVLSGYYWLNYVSIMPGGILAHKYGSKRVVGYAQLISSAMSSLIPMTAGYGPLTVSCIRAAQGVLSIGIITSVPNFAIGILSFGLAYSSDLIIEKKLLTLTAVRKLCTCIGGIASMIPLLIIAFTKCNLFLTISCLMINSVMKAFNTFGVILVVLDLSPKFSGILEGFSGSTSSFLTFVFSTMVNYFTTVYDIEALWKMVFLYTALFSIITTGMFLFLARPKCKIGILKMARKKIIN